MMLLLMFNVLLHYSLLLDPLGTGLLRHLQNENIIQYILRKIL